MKTVKRYRLADAIKLRTWLVPAIVLSLFIVSAAGCSEKYDKETNLIVTSWIKMARTDDVLPYYKDVIVYGYYADTVKWRVENYEDAKQGILKNVITGEVKQPDFVSRLNEFNNQDLGFIRSGRLMLVACDLYGHTDFESEMYAYREVELAEGLSELRVAVVFFPYETRERYEAGRWIMCNDNPPKLPEVEEPDEGE